MSNDMHCYRDDHALYREVLAARRKAHEKHGENSIEAEPGSSPRWLAILVEEIGEVANALTYDGPKGNLRAELIDVLAVGSAYVDAIDAESRQIDTVPNTGSYWIMTHPMATGTKWRCTNASNRPSSVRMVAVNGDQDEWTGTVAEFNNWFRAARG